jgi:hypothetical protein
MSLFGKLLAIFNVLAAIAFGCVAVLDYGQRQAWSHAVLRADTLIYGLPLDENETTVDGDKRFEELPTKSLDDHFSNAGGIPQKTQLLEVNRVKGAVQSWINQAPNDAERETIRVELVVGRAEGPNGPAAAPSLRYKSYRLGVRNRQLDMELSLEKSPFVKNKPEVIAALTKELNESVAKKRKLDEAIDSLSKTPLDDQAKRYIDDIFRERRLASVLLPFASSSGEYEDLFESRICSEPRNELGGLQGQLEAIFKQVLNGQVDANGLSKGAEQGRKHDLNPDERKLAAAQLLYNLIGVANSAVTLPRVVAVCGLANTARAIETQSQLTRKLAEDVGYAIENRDKPEFVAKQTRVVERSKDLADELRKLQAYKRAQEDVLSRQRDLVGELQADIDRLDKWLKAAKATTQEKLSEQAAMEKSLFDARKQLRDTQELNEKLEQQIRDLEKP